jgi:hypothetical protein
MTYGRAALSTRLFMYPISLSFGFFHHPQKKSFAFKALFIDYFYIYGCCSNYYSRLCVKEKFKEKLDLYFTRYDFMHSISRHWVAQNDRKPREV